MTSEQLSQWVKHPERLNRDTLYELRTQVARYPYAAPLRVLLLRNLYLLHDDTFSAELRKAALCVPDRRVLFYLAEGEHYQLTVEKEDSAETDYVAEPGTDRTESLIDAFLSTVSETVSDTLPMDYATDYATYLLQHEDGESKPEEDKPHLKGEELIDRYIAKVESQPVMLSTPHEQETFPTEVTSDSTAVKVEPDTEEDTCFTETLAKIYIKQQKYSKALEIIKKLHLKYPKKNAYFADQIRFLEKLIINANSK